MYLSKVEIVGFKSFPIKTELYFTDGLTAVVGPNGCGKTNIVDAIRWALGEQKAGVLRSDVMENVIFNGTRSRKPLGMAEVAITVLNNKQILPLEFSEITIKRRLFRNGESQYLLNNTQCRLRDIAELFMDTGMGADAYSVIELKMVESILSDRTDERRRLFEEAAGITKYKTRRREAQRKLNVVNEDIARVEDIIAEVQKNVNSLGRQAEKARQYKDVEEKSQILERLLVHWEYAAAAAAASETEREFALLQKQKSKLRDVTLEAETRLQKTEAEQEEARVNLEQINRREQELNRGIGQFSQQAAVAAERKSAIERERLRLAAEAEESVERNARLKENLAAITAKLGESQEHSANVENLYSVRRDTRNAAAAEVNRLRDTFRAAERRAATERTAASNARAKHERAAERVAGLRRRIEEIVADTERVAVQYDEIKNKRMVHEARREEFTASVAAAEEALKTAEDRAAALRAGKERTQNRIGELRSELAQAKASFDFLGGLIDTAESSQFLMKSNSWQPVGEKSLLAELVAAEEKFRVAIESALGEAGGCFMVQTRADALAGCATLRSSGKGKSTFICRDAIRPIPAPPAPPDGSFGWASELVRCDDDARYALRGLLGRAAVVETLDDAFAAISSGKADAAISLSGEIARANGVVRGGSTAKTEGMRVGKREQTAKLRGKIDALKADIATSEQEIAAINTELSGVNIPQFAANVRRAEAEKNNFEQQGTQLRFQTDALERSLANFTAQTERVRTDTAAAESEATAYGKEFETLREYSVGQEEISEQTSGAIRTAEQTLAVAEQEMQLAHINLIRTNAERDALRREIMRTNEQISAEQRNETQRSTEIQSLDEQFEAAVRLARSASEEADLLRDQRNSIRETKDGLNKRLEIRRAEYQTVAQEIREQREQHDRLTTIAHERELRLAEFRNRIEALQANAVENLRMTAEDLAAPTDGEPPTPEMRQELARLKRKLASLGNVNFLAIEEFSQENERLVFLRAQSDDLRQSKQTLDETIAEINTTAQRHFNDTFDTVARNFSELFGLLFGEYAEASIRLADGDPLEADIGITAKPAGKRPQSIELLSAGEKTLTAIALLFAIYLVKPSPFCILDEVDAPLDDANIERYLQLIRKFSENTQFLVVTHNKKTMESADILYGVTQEEEGVSRVVAAKFSEHKKSA